MYYTSYPQYRSAGQPVQIPANCPSMSYQVAPSRDVRPSGVSGPPSIIWDFDTAPTGSGGRGVEAVMSLVKLLKLLNIHETPIISFHYTGQEFGFSGKEQAITVIRRRVPVELLVPVKARPVPRDRDEVRAQIRWKIREHLQRADGSLLILISGDPNVIQWKRYLASTNSCPWNVYHLCPQPIWNEKWAVIADQVPDYLWHFNFGIMWSACL